MRIIVGNGKMAQSIAKSTDIVLSHKDIEITDEPAKLAKILRQAYQNAPPWFDNIYRNQEVVVVNTAAKINLEWCEQNREQAYKINTIGAVNLAKACDILGYKFVQISSGCIFDGEETGRVYTEEDTPTPASFYAVTKNAADELLSGSRLDIPILILRPRQIISRKAHPTNMLTKMLTLPDTAKFIVSQNSVTCLEDLGEMMDHLIKIQACGIYNCAQRGSLSPYEISCKLTTLKPGWNPQPTSYEEYLRSVPVKRVNTLLDIEKLEKTGYIPRNARDALAWCIENYE